MNNPPSDLLRSAELLKISNALRDLRDSLVLLSLTLTDLAIRACSEIQNEENWGF